MSESSDFDVLIVGAGLVGASFALALRDRRLRIGVIENAVAPAPQAAWDSRIYALSPASVEFLRAIGVWGALDAERVQRVERMEIHGDRVNAQLNFSAYEAGAEALAYILESSRLQYALSEALKGSDVELLCPARGSAFDRRTQTLSLEDGRVLKADLVVGADGANSWLRQAAGLEVRQYSYHQRGVVANFECAEPHQGVAFQWFRADGVLALLPLPGRKVSMVWSAVDAHAEALLAMDAEALCRIVEEASAHRVGTLRALCRAQAFPLRLIRAQQSAAAGIALIGDAAHVVHPLAGQGVNLGFGDAQVLAEVLKEREQGRSCGDHALLRRYERARAEPVLAMQSVTDGLQKLFAARGDFIFFLRNTGLNLSDRSSVLKTWLVRNALG